MNIRTFTFSILVITSANSLAQSSQNYFIPHLTKGQKLANIYSRTIAVSGEGIITLVSRVSGTSSYIVTNPESLAPVFEETDLYDGRKPSTGIAKIGLNGDNTYNGKSFANTSASGLLYNSFLWGAAKRKIKTGDNWKVTIHIPWELGGIGTQKVEVISVDEKNHTVTLKREGDGEGFFDSESMQLPITTANGKKVTTSVSPGKSHWSGYTTFKNGIVISDELLVIRPLKLTADGLTFDTQQREYILLNSMPVD